MIDFLEVVYRKGWPGRVPEGLTSPQSTDTECLSQVCCAVLWTHVHFPFEEVFVVSLALYFNIFKYW